MMRLFLFFVVSFLGSLLSLPSCNSCKSSEILICEQGTEGFDEIVLLNGDTIYAKPYPNNSGYWPLRSGKFYNFKAGTDEKYSFFCTEDCTVITGHIDDYITNDSFLLADRKPLDSILGRYQTFQIENGTLSLWRRANDTFCNTNDRSKAVFSSPIHDYWIIDQQTSDVYGPMSFEEYQQKREEFGVPDNLRLKCEKER